MPDEDDLSIASDRLVGARSIAEFRGEKLERTRYLIRIKAIPHYREGSVIVASKRALREHHMLAAKGEEAA